MKRQVLWSDTEDKAKSVKIKRFTPAGPVPFGGTFFLLDLELLGPFA